ncbi:threonine/serine exporter ThrE family protein [Saccharothrix longispora]|uniref:threonine/serine ThrE exporter family protein n=1 Tax=Saccharothrix longispora TaxID=33920 RepID=UPI0028FD054E|nr:threonine/serine exporter family protein [Saccharothrix longispora]MBY8850713.1 threonine/serine exporter family protein [Saccharothrix sp. MB29]MDU0289028.1 threonine/serine exporter family protein [Saccharothrix longispora]
MRLWRREHNVHHQARPVEGPSLPDDSTVHLVLDLALRVGEAQMAGGASAADVTATIQAVAGAYGLPHTEVDVIYTSITASCHRGTEAAPVTSMRVVRSRGLDYTRLTAVEDLIGRITTDRVSATEAYAEIDRVTRADHPYPRWVATLAWAGMAASVALLVGGGPLLAATAALVTAVIDRVGRFLNRRELPFFFQQVVGGALATAAALAMYATDLLPGTRPSLLVAAGIVVLLSGLSLVGTVQDAISGYNVTAAGRTVEVALLTAGLIAGIALTLRAGVQFGVRTTISDPLPPLIGDVPMQLATGAATSACFALASYAPPRALLVAAAAGGIGTTTYGLLALTGTNAITCAAAAATAVGFGGKVVSRRLRTPPLVVAVAGMVPLLPGWTTYRGLYQLTAEGDPAGLSTLVLAAGTALALAAGVVLGEHLGRPVRTGLGRLVARSRR